MDYEDPRSIAQEHDQLYWQMIEKNTALLSDPNELEDLIEKAMGDKTEGGVIEKINRFGINKAPYGIPLLTTWLIMDIIPKLYNEFSVEYTLKGIFASYCIKVGLETIWRKNKRRKARKELEAIEKDALRGVRDKSRMAR